MRFTVFLIALFIFSSCGKKTEMKGRIVNPVTNEGISGINVYVTRPKAGIGYDGNGTKILFETVSDENGYFTIEERFRKSKSYTISYGYDQDKYKLVQEQVSPAGYEYNDTYFEFRLLPLGKYVQSVKNVNCFDNNDALDVDQYYFRQDLYSNSFNQDYLGCVDEQYSVATVPMGWYFFKGTVTRNGITTPFADSVYVTEGGYHVWDIEY